MFYILFALYLLVFTWLVTRTRFFRRSELSSGQLALIFLFKVVIGVFYAWLGIYYNKIGQNADTWHYHWQSMKEYDLLMKDPGEFFKSLFYSGYESGYGDFFSTSNSWWNDVKSNIFRKFLAILDVFSFGNYYINLVFYSFITLFGNFAVYRVMKHNFPLQRVQVFIGSFMLPSFIFFSSGIHKDGIVFLCIAMLLYIIYFTLRGRKLSWIKIVVMVSSILILLLMRNFLVLILIPAVVAWIIAYKGKKKPVLVFASVYTVFILLFFTAKYIHPALDFPVATMERQSSFVKMNAGTSVTVKTLEPDFMGFLKLLPQSIYLSVLRPSPGDIRHLQLLAGCAEIYAYLLLFAGLLFFRLRTPVNDLPFLLFCVFFGCSVLLMIGYSVNSLGAIVRYRSLVLPFLLTPVIALTDWKRMLSRVNII